MHTAIRTLAPPLRPVAPVAARRASSLPLRVARGQTLFYAEDEAAAFFEIIGGTLRCCRLTDDGRRQVFRFARPGDVLGLSAEGSYGYSAEAVTPVTALRRRLGELDAAMAEDAVLRRRVVQTLRAELAATRDQMILLGRLTASERLACFLRSLAPAGLHRGACIELPMSRTDIGDYLGLAMETVSRKFAELVAHGAIRLETPQRIRILDPGRLEAMAGAA